MKADKSQLDTLQIYLSQAMPAAKVKPLLAKFAKADHKKADAVIRMFETRGNVQPRDIERVLG